MEKPLPRSFWQFYRSLFKRALFEAYNMLDGLLTFVAIVVFLVSMFSSAVATWLEQHWSGLSRWWSLVPLVLVLIWRMAKANYDHFERIVNKVDLLTTENEKLTWPEDRPKLSFNYWGRVEPQFLALDARNNSYQLAQHGFYLKNDGGVALDVTVAEFQIESEPPLTAVGGTTPRIEANGNGFVSVWIRDEVRLSMYALDVAMRKGFEKGRSDLTSVLTEHDAIYEVQVSVRYRDFNNNWYVTHSSFRFICDVWHTDRLEFGAPRQERFMPPSIRDIQRSQNEAASA